MIEKNNNLNMTLEYAIRFLSFVQTYKDNKGNYKYQEELRRVINEKDDSFFVDFSDIYRYDYKLAIALLNELEDVKLTIPWALYNQITYIDPSYEDKVKQIIIYPIIKPMDFDNRYDIYVDKPFTMEGIVGILMPSYKVPSNKGGGQVRTLQLGLIYEPPEVVQENEPPKSILTVFSDDLTDYVLLADRVKLYGMLKKGIILKDQTTPSFYLIVTRVEVIKRDPVIQ